MKTLILLILLMPMMAFAGTETIEPDADIVTTNWLASTGSDYFALLIDDSDVTVDSCYDNSNNGSYLLFTCEASVTPADSIIDSVNIHGRSKVSNVANNAVIMDSVGGQAMRLTSVITYAAANTYYDKYISYATDPDGGAWSWADIDDLLIGFEANNIGNNQEVVIAEHYAIVYFHDPEAVAGSGQVIMITGGDD